MISRTLRAAAIVVCAALVAATGCSDRKPTPSSTVEDRFGHIHGLGVDPASGELYVASHGGVFRLADGSPELVADRRQDTMAFTVVGPHHFLASGHPAPTEDKPSHLGLIESTDAAQTWTVNSLGGTADFHALEPAGDLLYGYDSQSGTLMTTQDHQSWTRVLSASIIDLAAHPENPDHLLLTTPSGVQKLNNEEQPQSVGTRTDIALIDWPSPGTVVALTAAGTVLTRTDRARTWKPRASLDGDVQALDASGPTWYAATTDAISTSDDQGRTWSTLLELKT